MAKSYKPGQKAPVSGQYGIRGERGGDTGKERTVVKGEPLPPTPKPGAGLRRERSDQERRGPEVGTA
jgi:hypothetical protein